ncbi:MAG: ABC transporter ATP-binding protein [bacterium]|nr:ABC transporter ATP-binding protein [bacterium]
MIEVDRIHKSFGAIPAVQGVSFVLQPGQVTGLLGPNGAGKTTTIRMVAGFLAPDRGRVTIQGHDTIDHPLHARRLIGYLPESVPTYPEMRVREYLTFRCRLFGMDRGVRKKAVEWALDRCRVTDVGSRQIGTLSKGYRQRVGLASVLVHNPPVLVLDEPTNGLDPTQIGEARSLVVDLARDRTLLISSHILPEIERLCSRVIIIAGGLVKADGPVSSLGGNDRVVFAQIKISKAGDESRLRALFLGMPFIASAEPVKPEAAALRDGFQGWRLGCSDSTPDALEAVGAAIAANGLVLRELRTEAASLERIFMRAIESAGAVS